MRPLIGFILLFVGCHSAAKPIVDYKPTAAAILILDGTAPAPTPTPSGKCSNCNGTGKLGDGTVVLPCPVCGGDGIVANNLPLINLVSWQRRPLVQPAPEAKTAPSTTGEQDAHELAASSLEQDAATDATRIGAIGVIPATVAFNSPPPASPPARNAATATGQWITVKRPIYGRFGRLQGYQHVRQWQPFKGKWVATPHYAEGHWVECTAQQMAERTGIKSWAGHPFSQYRWEWNGITDADKTWTEESPPGKLPPKPNPWVWVPDNDPFAPGQRMNL